MRVPSDFDLAFDHQLAVAQELQKAASPKLQALCKAKSWLFDDRVKNAESALSKLEAGIGPLSTLHDLYAATVVVPTQNEVESALREVSDAFTVLRRPPRNYQPDSFGYDDIHLIVSLRGAVSPVAVNALVLDRPFEIQVRTGLQYAWWRATHDQVFKRGGDFRQGWAILRTQAQARASLEMLDAILADLNQASLLQKTVDYTEMEYAGPISWLEMWSSDRRPLDSLRFAKSVMHLALVAGVSLDDVHSTLQTPTVAQFVDADEITPVQAVLAALDVLIPGQLGDRLEKSQTKVLLTSVFLREYPPIAQLPDCVRVAFEG